MPCHSVVRCCRDAEMLIPHIYREHTRVMGVGRVLLFSFLKFCVDAKLVIPEKEWETLSRERIVAEAGENILSFSNGSSWKMFMPCSS